MELKRDSIVSISWYFNLKSHLC